MANDSNEPKLPSEALDLFLDGVLAEVREPSDTEALKEARAAFRRRIPFPLRSYAAAVLILRAAGFSRGSPKPDFVSERQPREGGKARGKEPKPVRQDRAPAEAASDERSLKRDASPRSRFKGEGTTIFFSMGKRQRFHPHALIDLIVDVAGIGVEHIGDVRSFDNYSFADIDPDVAQTVVSTLNGVELRGRRLSVNLARKRDEAEE